MSYSSVISSKGQVTVPQEIRMRLGLKEGDRLEFLIEGDRTVIRPARITENPFEKYAGALATFPGGEDEINHWLDELRSEDSGRPDNSWMSF
jgi:looped-hinge helix DNA binding domain, AbrB family